LQLYAVSQIADYVAQIGEPDSESLAGKTQYDQYCSACHGLDGSGNVALGAPRLSDNIWLYGGELDTVRTTIAHGRNGAMPAFDQRLDDAQIKLLVAKLAR